MNTMESFEIDTQPDAFDEDVEVTKVVWGHDKFSGEERRVGAFGSLPNGDGVYINAKASHAAKLEEGDEYKMRMIVNQKYLSGESETKYFAFFVYLPGTLDLETDPQGDLEEAIAEETQDEKAARKWRKKRAMELVELGGVWTPQKLAESVTRTKMPIWGEMTEEQQGIVWEMRTLCETLHKKDQMSRIVIRNRVDQKNASYVFFTTATEKLVKALKKS